MEIKGRKFVLKTSSSIPSDAKGIFNTLSSVYDLHYIGVYNVLEETCVYVHTKNVVSGKRLMLAMRSFGADVSSIDKIKQFVGEMVSDHGRLLINGVRFGKAKKEQPVSVVKESAPEPEPPASAVQPATSLPKPFRKIPNSLTILDNVYSRIISGPTDPNSFHAVWSSDSGLWFPAMWVGPVRNIFPAPRSNIKSSVVDDLLEDQSQKCRLCGTDVFMGVYSNADVDHIIPLSYGGSCDKGNLQVLCVTCHRRKTALECKKVVAVMGSSQVTWLDGIIYLTNTHVHFDVGSMEPKNPKEALDSLGSKPGVFVLDS